MSKGFKLTGAALIAVVLMASSPAMARPRGGWGQGGGWSQGGGWNYGGGGYYGGRHRRGGGIDGGDILLGAAIIGGIAVLANEASKADGRRRGTYDDRYRGDANRDDGSRGADSRDYGDTRSDRYRSGRGDENAAAQICTDAAERRAGGQVDSVDVVRRDGQGWRVEGTVANGQPFLCGTSNGRADFVQLRDAPAFAESAY